MKPSQHILHPRLFAFPIFYFFLICFITQPSCLCLCLSCCLEDGKKGERCWFQFLSACIISFPSLFWFYLSFYFSITSFPRPLPVSVPGSPLFNSPVPPCFPLRSFPNFWSPSGAAWRGLFLSSLPSRQEQHWNWKLCLLSTTTTRRPTNCWSAGGFADS